VRSREVSPAAGSTYHPGPMVAIAHERLAKALGAPRAAQITKDALAAIGDRPFDGPQDLLDLAAYMINLGGLARMVGHSLKVQALLRGAIEH
jgi:hypothetical protein